MTTPPPLTYPYLPLDPSTPSIRLLTFTHPASASSSPNTVTTSNHPPITLALTHTPLTPLPTPTNPPSPPPPKFSALSYVWGAPAPTASSPTVLINAHPTRVTPNLHAALARLARQRFAGPVWIDALCINQADAAEKSSQVAMMGRIYGLAERVVVWLGEDGDDDESGDGAGAGAGALHAVRELGVLFREQVRDFPGGKGLGDARRVEGFVRTVVQFSVTAATAADAVSTGTGPRVGFDFEAIWRLFRKRPWWRRVWIIQEVVLAREAVMLCGADPEARGASVPWEDVRECIRLMEWMVLYPNTAPEHRRLYALLGDLYPNISHLALASDGYRRSLEEGKGKSGAEGGGLPLLDTIIWTSLGTSVDGAIQSTDPRDRIYGLLGMIREEDRGKIPVDYSTRMTVGRVLFAVAKALLQAHGPDILSFCQRTSPPPDKDLPSWVPDWTAPRMIPLIGGVFFGTDSEAQLRGNASKGANWQDWALKCTVEDVVYELPVVTLAGVIVGRVEKIGQVFQALPGSPEYLDACRDWLLEATAMVKQGAGVVGLEKETWRVPIADFGLGKRADAEGPGRFIHGFDVLTGRVPLPAELENDAARRGWVTSESWDYRRIWKVYERRAFVDDAGRPGLGPQDMASEDLVVVFAGAHVPFILRQTTAAPLRYRVLGPAFVHGLMDGEGITETCPFGEIHVL